MSKSQLIYNYSKSLFAIATYNKAEQEVLEQLQVICSAFTSSQIIQNIIKSPIIKKNYKIHLINSLTQNFNISSVVRNFLLIAVKNSRLTLLPEIIKSYKFFFNHANKVQTVEVSYAKELDANDQQLLINYLTRYLKQNVEVNFKHNRSIIGGIIIQYGSILIDCSISGAMAQINKLAYRKLI